MKTIRRDFLIWIILVIPFIIIGFFWNKFPAEIPIHFDVSGEPNDYAGKVVGLFLMPGINIAVYFFLLILPKIDPSKKNYPLFDGKFQIIRTVLHAFLTLVFILTAMYSLGFLLNISTAILFSLTFLFLIIGNYLGTVRHNYFIGIRTPWTLANEEVWKKTHRLAGVLWVVMSVLMLMVLFILPITNATDMFLYYVIIISAIPMIYSYLVFRKLESNKTL